MATVAFSSGGLRIPTANIAHKNKPMKWSGKERISYKGSGFFGSPLQSAGMNLQNLDRKHGFVVGCSASSRTGKVGTHRREGNASLASFGIKPKRFPNGLRILFTQSLSGMLPLVVAGTAAAALINPATFAWFSREYYAPALGGIMLSIGVQLSVKDFALAFQRPLPLAIGYLAQYLLKPILGLIIVRAFGTPPIFAAGFILTACVSGAQLSSYASFLSKGDVALSIVLTSFTTISSVVVTPLLTGLLIGSVVPVDAVAMSKSILQARGKCLQNHLTMYRNAKLYSCWTFSHPVSWQHSCSPGSLFCGGHGYHGSDSCILLGQRIQNPRHAC